MSLWIDIAEEVPKIGEEVIALSPADTETPATYSADGKFQIHDKIYPSLRVFLAGVTKWKRP